MACPKCDSSSGILIPEHGCYVCSNCWAEWTECDCGEPACSVCCEHIYGRTCRCDVDAVRLAAESDPRWGMH